MAKRDLNLLKDRVKARLSELGMTPAEAARRGNLDKDFIYDLLNDRKKTVRADSIAKLAFALDCDWQHLDGRQVAISVVKFTEPAQVTQVKLIGEVATGVYTEIRAPESDDIFSLGISSLPPDVRFPLEAQVDLFVRGSSINRFAPRGFILRCVLLEHWPNAIRDGDLVVVDRFKNGLRERAAWRVRPSQKFVEYTTDSDFPAERTTWRVHVERHHLLDAESDTYHEIGDLADDAHQPFAVVLFAYAEPRVRRGL